MKCAVVSDIHGNLRAFEAVLADAKACGADTFIFLGDLVFMGLDPQLCFDLLMEQPNMVVLKGNTDLFLEKIQSLHGQTNADEQMIKLIRYADIRMQAEAKEKLASWPTMKRIEYEGISLLCCHGSPYVVDEGLYENQPFSPALEKHLAEESVDIVVSGHTHIHADFVRNGIRFINPGAVGYSLDGDVRASYALLTVNDGNVYCKFRRVEYDIKRYLMEVEHAMEGFKLLDRLHHALIYGKHKS